MPKTDVRTLRIEGDEVDFWIQEVVQPGTSPFTQRALVGLAGRELRVLEEPPTWDSVLAYPNAELARLFAGVGAAWERVTEGDEQRRPA